MVKVSRIYIAVIFSIIAVQGSSCKAMDAGDTKIRVYEQDTSSGKVLPSLSKDVLTIIVREYFKQYDLTNFEETRVALRNLMEGLCTRKLHSIVLSTLQDLYGQEHMTKLILACEVSDSPCVVRWIMEYTHTKDEVAIPAGNTTPFISAITSDSAAAARTLLKMSDGEHGVAPIMAENEDGTTPLMATADENNVQALRFILSKDPSALNAVDKNGYTALHKAIARKNYCAVHTLLEADADTEIAENTFGYTPLHTAIELGDPTLVRKLLRHSADPNRKTGGGTTPLVGALNRYSMKDSLKDQALTIIKQLLQNPAINVHEPGRYGQSPLAIALSCAIEEVISELRIKSIPTLHHSYRRGDARKNLSKRI